MGYKLALEIAGAEVLAFETFGSYQGDWLAKVKYIGRIGWIHDYYGSCSGCDAFESAFGFISEDHPHGEYYNPFYANEGFVEGCVTCDELKRRLILFGQRYLDEMMSYEVAFAHISQNDEWDMEVSAMKKFMEENK